MPLLIQRLLLACVVPAALVLGGCATAPSTPPQAATAVAEAAQAPEAAREADKDADDEPAPLPEALPNVALTPQIFYQLLLAEIAGQRGNLPLSVSAYLDLAKTTRDPRIARRAAEIAHFARRPDAALDAARLWVELEPNSLQARQMLAGLLAAVGRYDEIPKHIAVLLARESKEKLPEALLRLNRMFARVGDRQAVQDVIVKLTEPYLGLPEAHLARAQAAAAAGNTASALAECEAALRLRPQWEAAALLKAQVLGPSAPGEAIEWLKHFLEANPKARDARLQYARLLTGDRQYEAARREFQSLLAEFPDNADVIFAVGALSFQLQDLRTAETSFRALVERNIGDTATARLYLGQIAENQKRLQEALDWYGSITSGEQQITAQIRYAGVLGRMGRTEEAREYLQKAAASSNRDRVQLLLAEAQLLRDAGRVKDAFELLDTQLQAQPNQPDLLYESALLAERVGRNDVLESNLRRLIQIKPDHAHAYNALGYSLADRNERIDEAYQLVAKALEYAPEDPFILDSMGWVLYRKGDLRGAREYLERALKLRPDPEIAAHLGEVLWMLGERDNATRMWREAAKAHPDNDVLDKVIKRFLN